MSASVVVVGSLNMDLVMRMARVPAGGETLVGHGFETQPGGKGANQAIASARMGASVAMVGRVGDDAHGTALLRGLAADGIDAKHVPATALVASGVAMIWVEDSGQNRIVLAAGANDRMTVADVDLAGRAIDSARVLIAQFEVPMPVVQAAVARAHDAGVTVLLNPAPAAALPTEMWAQIDILVVNESEASSLAAIEVRDVASARAAGTALRSRGVGAVLVTLGAQGVVAVDAHGERHAPAMQVAAVDTTAAGDTFIGALAAALCEGQTLDQAIVLGQAASALCVTRPGAQASIPFRREIAP